MTRRGAVLYLAGMAAALALPIVAARVHPLPEGRCERDGVATGALPAARWVAPDGGVHDFCSIACAEAWIARRGATGGCVLVRDEAGGALVASDRASYVRRRLAGLSGDRVLAFARRDDAARHAKAFGDKLLGEGEGPFAGDTRRPAGAPAREEDR